MSQKQTAFFLADYAMQNSLTLNQVAFTCDGSFFMYSPDTITMGLFGCTSAAPQCKNLLDSIRKPLDTEFSLDDQSQMKEFFSAEYIDPNNLVNNFVSYVHLCANSYRKYSQDFFAPYIALVQSSGSGKTRLLRECSDLIPTLYVCFRSGQSGYPPATSNAIASLFEKLDRSRDLSLCIEQMVERLRRVEISARVHLTKPGVSRAGYVKSKPEFPSEQLPHVWNLDDIDLNRSVPSYDGVVLLVLDEARWLLDKRERMVHGLNLFHFFRRALDKYWAEYPDARLFAVMVDTSSKIENFAPHFGLDESARAKLLEGGGQLLHPYVLLGSFDAYFERFKLPKGTRDLTPLLSSKHYLFAGRPLVAIPFSDTVLQLSFLARKLFGGSTPDWEKPSLGPLSVVLSRLGTSINCQSPIASDLVAGHMVYLLASDLTRTQMFVAYLAEPRLALAAAMLWSSEPVLVNKLIPALHSAMVAGTVGALGEIVGQLILLIACDTACLLADKKPGEVVPLVNVLEQLLPADSALNVLEAIPVSLHSASVACGQMVQLAHNFDLDTNVRLAERHCGASFMAMQQGVDFVLPIIAESPAATLFQIKNLANTDNPCALSHNCTYAMLPSIALSGNKLDAAELDALDEHCVRIYMQVGASVGQAILSPRSSASEVGNSAIAKPLQIFGLSSRCLSENIRRSLQMLLNTGNKIEFFVAKQKSSLESDATKAHHPYPDTIESIRQCFPFVIDPDSQWSDYTARQLQALCVEYGVKFKRKSAKAELIDLLTERFPFGPTSLTERSPMAITSSQVPMVVDDSEVSTSSAPTTDSRAPNALGYEGQKKMDWSIFTTSDLKNGCKVLRLKKYSGLLKADLLKKLDLATQNQKDSSSKLYDDLIKARRDRRDRLKP